MQNLNEESTSIYINNLEIETLIGVNDYERKKKQSLILKGSFFFNQRKKVDSIQSTVDYDKLITTIKKTSLLANYFLMEALAEKIVENIFLENPLVDSINLSLAKKSLYDFEIGIKLKRVRNK